MNVMRIIRSPVYVAAYVRSDSALAYVVELFQLDGRYSPSSAGELSARRHCKLAVLPC